MAPRAMNAPGAPVSANSRSTSAQDMRSPLPMTGTGDRRGDLRG